MCEKGHSVALTPLELEVLSSRKKTQQNQCQYEEHPKTVEHKTASLTTWPQSHYCEP